MDKEEIGRAIKRLSHEILERNPDISMLAIVGIKYRGMYLAERIAKEIRNIKGAEIPVGALDITLYRDDVSQVSEQPVVHETTIDFDVNGKIIILVDDVLYTGRTVRCALDELIDFGRPKMIQLAVLIDRGHRELPIRPDFVGKSIPTSLEEAVEVKLNESDGQESVILCEKG
ncbi:MAG: bifunctional pyr operon transcriptional regulator/uracil phosphoribosyltransferase PyrR [Candidatus Omnitrophica bacterium]|nr:bifunctional pyr operon transcriptional regulator/uracil phosphoribosyltransferase PyrR [Candidatus Omnitrophota bacterium]